LLTLSICLQRQIQDLCQSDFSDKQSTSYIRNSLRGTYRDTSLYRIHSDSNSLGLDSLTNISCEIITFKINQKFTIEDDKIVITVSNRGLRLADKNVQEITLDKGSRDRV